MSSDRDDSETDSAGSASESGSPPSEASRVIDDGDGVRLAPGSTDEGPRVTREAQGSGGDEDMGRAGWVLVVVVLLSVLVIPGLIYLYPNAPGDAGLSFLLALLVLPFLPALLLGLAAVWSMTAGRNE